MSISTATKKNRFYQWMTDVDRILRGEATQPSDIQQADINVPVVGISVVIIALATVYGFCMGVFALAHGVEHGSYHRALLQTFASMAKVPLLFLLTLLVTFPSLYVFNALVGSKLKIVPVLKLLVASLAVNLAVLASLGPILAFFSVSTPNYAFIVLLNVLMFTLAGALGLSFLVQTLNRLAIAGRGQLPATTGRRLPASGVSGLRTTGQPLSAKPSPLSDSAEKNVDSGDDQHEVVTAEEIVSAKKNDPAAGPLDRLEGVSFGHHVKKVFVCWIIVFGLVGAQMGWVLRPFIGSPSKEFQLLRHRESNFFEAIFNVLQSVFFGS